MTLTVARVVEPSPIRRVIAARLGESRREAIQVALHRSVDVTAVVRAAAAARDSRRSRSLTDVLIAAVATALVEHPEFNAVVDDRGQHALVNEVNIGLATDSPRGLVVPVLKGADQLAFDELCARRRELVDRVLAKRQTLEDLADPTFTISNLGTLGVDLFDPVINPPQVAILGVGRIRDELAPHDGAGVCTVHRLTLSLCFDHRFLDGAPAARFLGAIAGALEEPGRT